MDHSTNIFLGCILVEVVYTKLFSMAPITAFVTSFYLFCGILLRILKRWSLESCIVISFYFTTKGYLDVV